jgi:hypothetical protein
VIGTTSLFFAFDCPYMAEITPGTVPTTPPRPFIAEISEAFFRVIYFRF